MLSLRRTLRSAAFAALVILTGAMFTSASFAPARADDSDIMAAPADSDMMLLQPLGLGNGD
jgi:hypothetical protein